jgi:hypothetical protein
MDSMPDRRSAAAGINPARGDLFIGRRTPKPPPFFVFQGRGGKRVGIRRDVVRRAPEKQKNNN